MAEKLKLRIGCPVWSCPHWRGKVYKPKSPRANWLRDYSQVFSTVEGNSTFYGIPAPETFSRWAAETAAGFRFALKFPRIISHEKQLKNAELETDQFLAGLDILHDADRLGPSFLQLGPGFGPQGMNVLRNYLESLPQQFPYAVEVRHLEFFKEPAEAALNQMLAELGIDRVIFDSRPLFSQKPDDEIEQVSQQRKPKSPVRKTVTGSRPILRLVGRNDLSLVLPWVEQWTEQVAQWIKADLEPYVFLHAPDDQYAPDFAQMFNEKIQSKLKAVDDLPLRNRPKKIQRSLF